MWQAGALPSSNISSIKLRGRHILLSGKQKQGPLDISLDSRFPVPLHDLREVEVVVLSSQENIVSVISAIFLKISEHHNF